MWQIRPAEIGEMYAITDLVNSAYRGDSSRAGWTTEADLLDGQRTDPDAVAAMISSPSHTILVAADDEGRLVGCVSLERRPRRIAYLGMLTVDPTLQSRGLGRLLLERSEEYARVQWDAIIVEMTVIHQRTELIAWYQRRGYTPTGETRPFPVQDPRFGLPRVPELDFIVVRKALTG